MKLKHFDMKDNWCDILTQVEQDGGVIVDNFINNELLKRLIQELKPHADGFEPGIQGNTIKQVFCGSQTKRFTGLARRAPSFVEVINHDLLHTWAENSFNNDYWMNTGQAIIIGPGEPAQFLHRDSGNWPVMLAQGKNAPEATLSIMLALTDFTEENGATCVVPGSHKWDDWDKRASPEQVTQAVMPAGAALLYTGKTIHGGGENKSKDSWRFGIHLSFALAQLTPEEAHTVTVPWEVAQNYPERVQHMLGYYSHRSFQQDWPILWTFDYRDVREYLAPAPSGEYLSAGAKKLQGAAMAAK